MYQNIASIWVKYFVFATLNGIKKFPKAKYNIIFLVNISLKVRKYDKAELP